MILIKYNGIKDFEYDIQGLVKSFFPGEQMAVDKNVDARLTIETDISDSNILLTLTSDGTVVSKEESPICREDRKDTKNRLKRLVYDILSDYTRQTLPWGTLSGIRPTKITTSLLEEGRDIPWIRQHMKNEYYLSDKKTELSIGISKRELDILKDIDYKNGYSIYIGIPFCPSTCSYCSFTSYPLAAYRKKVDSYIDALCREMRFVGKRMRDKNLNTIYIGGGTPTTLEPHQMKRFFEEIYDTFDMGHLKEFTVEAGRPDSITPDKLKVMADYNITRISVNPQTMNEKTLKLIGRRHTVKQIHEAFDMARAQGFHNINMDFIVGLPEENIDDVRYTMEETKKISPDSITIHSLCVKRAAKLNTMKEEYRNYSYINDENIMDMTQKYANDMGMKPYYLYRQKNMTGNLENVGYSVPGKAGIYNILIMEERQSIVALGAGASSKMVFQPERFADGKFPEDKQIHRIENVKDVDCYIERIDGMIERKVEFLDKYSYLF